MASSSAAELARVQLEPPRPRRQSEELDDLNGSDSEPESAVTEEPEDEDGDFDVDAIKWAQFQYYKATGKKRGRECWVYAVMWNQYLKTASDSLQTYNSFSLENGRAPLVDEFWATVGRRIPPGRTEPAGKLYRGESYGETVECPRKLLKRWFHQVEPRRYIRVYDRRRAKELAGEPLTKADSDYYMHKKRQALMERRRQATASGAAYPSPVSSLSSLSDPSSDEEPEEVEEPVVPPPSLPRPSQVRKLKRIASSSPDAPILGESQPEAGPSEPKKARSESVEVTQAPLPDGPSSIATSPIPPAVLQEGNAQVEHSALENPSAATQPSDPIPSEAKGIEPPEASASAIPPEPTPAKPGTTPEVTPNVGTHIVHPSSPIASLKPPDPPELVTDKSSAEVTVPRVQPETLAPPTPTTAPSKEESPASKALDEALLPSATKSGSPEVVDLTRDDFRQLAKKTSMSPPLPARQDPTASRESTAGPKSPVLKKQPIPISQRPRYQQPRLTKDVDPLDAQLEQRVRPPGRKSSKDLTGVRAPSSTETIARPPAGPAMSSSFVPRQTSGGSSAQPIPRPLPPQHLPPQPTNVQAGPAQPPPWESRQQRRWAGQQPSWAAQPYPQPPPPSQLALARPPPPVPPVFAGNYSPNAPYGGMSPSWTQQQSAGHFPTPYAPQLGAPLAPNNIYDQARDPRRRPTAITNGSHQAVPATPLSAGGDTPLSRHSISDTGSRRIETLAWLRVSLQRSKPDQEVLFDMRLMRGSQNNTGHDLLRQKMASESGMMPLFFEEMGGELFDAAFRHGAKMLQWGKLSRTEVQTRGGADRKTWEAFKVRAEVEQTIWVSYLDAPLKDGTNPEHLALVIVSGPRIDLSSLGYGDWKKSEIGLALVLLSLPLKSLVKPPRMVNPVRPLADTALPRPFEPYPAPTSIMASYGVSPPFTRTLCDKAVMKYPRGEGPCDLLNEALVDEFKMNGAKGQEANGSLDIVIISNAKLRLTLVSSTLRQAPSKKTKFYAVGPSLYLHPTDWTLRPIWTTGGLVAFSPTLILRSPHKLREMMDMIRVSDSWGAYILPSVVEWVEASWKEKARCPDPNVAYDALNSALLAFDGTGSGLAVSVAPPPSQLPQACTAWLDWLHIVTSANSFEAIFTSCRGVRSGTYDFEPRPEGRQLDLMDIEQEQIEDLTMMRAQPHVVPYRRYLYVGEVSLDRSTRDRLGSAIEFVQADDFAAIFSGVRIP